MTKKILIAGGSGLIGKRLTRTLLEHGYAVAHLGRSISGGKVPTFIWDPEKGTYDKDAITGIDVVINLAGAGVADKRWTASRKKIIAESRVKSVALLSKLIVDSTVQTVIGASAIGYYGFSKEKIFKESDPAGSDFLAQVTREWEEAYHPINKQDKRLVNFRIGIVLAKEGGALQEMAKPIRYFVGAPLGSGEQELSWIHIDDLCAMVVQAIEQNEMRGVYNAVAPNPVTNKQMTYAIAKKIHRPILVPFVPAFALFILLGEMAQIVLNGSVVSSKKIEASGFEFSFPELSDALHDLL